MLSRLALQPAFSFNTAKLRYQDSSLQSPGSGMKKISDAQSQEFMREIDALQQELYRAQHTMADVFRTLQNMRSL